MAGLVPRGRPPVGLLARQGSGYRSACLALSLTDLVASTSLDGRARDGPVVGSRGTAAAPTGAAATGTARTGIGGISCTPPGGSRRGGDGNRQGPRDKCWSMDCRSSIGSTPPLPSARLGSARLRTDIIERKSSAGEKKKIAQKGLEERRLMAASWGSTTKNGP
jgi:hypothetical protein